MKVYYETIDDFGLKNPYNSTCVIRNSIMLGIDGFEIYLN